jgi:hypothetical protein
VHRLEGIDEALELGVQIFSLAKDAPADLVTPRTPSFLFKNGVTRTTLANELAKQKPAIVWENQVIGSGIDAALYEAVENAKRVR